MKNKKRITCILCPMGCEILVELDVGKCNILKGMNCGKGKDFVINEALNPKRILTSSILVKDGFWPLVSVRSSEPIPKDKISLVLDEIKKKKIQAPVYIGDIIIKDSANTGIDIVATKSIDKINQT